MKTYELEVILLEKDVDSDDFRLTSTLDLKRLITPQENLGSKKLELKDDEGEVKGFIVIDLLWCQEFVVKPIKVKLNVANAYFNKAQSSENLLNGKDVLTKVVLDDYTKETKAENIHNLRVFWDKNYDLTLEYEEVITFKIYEKDTIQNVFVAQAEVSLDFIRKKGSFKKDLTMFT